MKALWAVLLVLAAAALLHRTGRHHAAQLAPRGRLSPSDLAAAQTAWSAFHAANASKGWHNVATGETWWRVANENDTGGKYWEMYEHMAPGGFVNVQHVHPYQSELIEVVHGAVRCALGSGALELHEGSYVIVPAGVSHGLHNLANSTLLRVRYEPALEDMDSFFATLARLSRTGRLDWLGLFPGVPAPPHTVLLWARHPALMSFVWLPDALQDAAAALAPLVRAAGYSLD